MPEQKASTVYLPASPTDAIAVFFPDSGERVYADPYTGEVLGKQHANSTAIRFLVDLHVHLLAGKDGERLPGWTVVGGIVLSLLGVSLWWPKRRRWRQAFSIKRGASGLRVWLDVHRVAGACACVLLMMTAATGSALALFDSVTEPAMIALTGKGARQHAPKSVPATRRASLDAML